MTQAFLEIIGMLLVAVAIGVFFTYRYWKSKYDEVQKENEQLSKDLAKQTAKVESLNKEISATKSAHEDEVNQLKEKFKKDSDKTKKESDEHSKKLESEIADLKKQLEKEQKNSKKFQKKEKELAETIEIKDEQLGEKERELEEIAKQLNTSNISYYKQIDGKRYKAAIIAEADEAVAGVGDGRVSKADAEKIFATISDGHMYTQVEKDTMHYIRENYNWTPEADELFRTKVRSWAAKGHQLD